MLGDLSAKYESSGDPGSVSSGYQDPGGKSYGAYQLSSNAGSLQSFLNWMCNSDDDVTRQYGNALAEYELVSDEFDDKWRQIAMIDSETFLKQQHDYIEYAYYFPAVEALRENMFDVDKHNPIMADVVWSRSVQYGNGQIVEMFIDAVKSLGYPNLSYVDDPAYDAKMIEAIYMNVCHTEEWTVSSCRYGLYQRFENECQEALAQI